MRKKSKRNSKKVKSTRRVKRIKKRKSTSLLVKKEKSNPSFLSLQEIKIRKKHKLLMKMLNRYWKKYGKTVYKSWRRWTRRSKHNVVYGVSIVAAFMLIWRGFWYLADELPTLQNPVISVILGLAIILFLGARAKLFEF